MVLEHASNPGQPFSHIFLTVANSREKKNSGMVDIKEQDIKHVKVGVQGGSTTPAASVPTCQALQQAYILGT